MIVLENLSKTFFRKENRIDVLKGLSLRIERGASVAILGASGAGKTTLIHIMGMLDHPTCGRLLIDGMDVFQWDERTRAVFRNSRIGFVFQFYHLLPEFNALENTMMPALIGRLPKEQAVEKACKLLQEVGLEKRMRHKPGELSGGEQQRVAIARALMRDPDILLVDEPTGNLDTETGKKIEDILIQLNLEKKITLVTVTHNKVLAERMSKQFLLRDGALYGE